MSNRFFCQNVAVQQVFAYLRTTSGLFVYSDRSYPLTHLACFAIDYTLQLCLNSGEIIKMSPEMTMMFEVREEDVDTGDYQ